MTLNPVEQKVYDALKKAGVTTSDKAKKVDDIVKLCGAVGKGQVASAIASLTSKGFAAVGGPSRANAYYLKK
ncbi:MAG TPA: hypothetical protein VI997_08950 [Candidatus Thermoplasmatota archaeon]|nr:hypothetical protein [Candidatus Thermoplasmatota archaeon]